MTHIGKKFAFGTVGILCLFFGGLEFFGIVFQFFLCPFALVNIARHPQKPGQIIFFAVNTGQYGIHP